MAAKSPDPQSPFFTPAQLAAYLKLSDDVLYKWRLNGEGPRFIQLVPRRFLYRKTDVEEWLERQRKVSILKPKRRRRSNNRTSQAPVA